MENRNRKGDFVFSAIAFVLAVAVAVLFGGVLYAVARGAGIVDIVVLIVLMIIFAGMLYIVYLRDSPGDSELLLTGAGASVGLIAYIVWYVVAKGFDALGNGEIVMTVLLIVLAAVAVYFTISVHRGKRIF